MSPQERVTIFIPAHNAMPHLRHTVDSILAQSHGEFRVLVVNDGSTDGTAEFLDSIRDPRFRVIHQANCGLVAAANRVLELVDTEYLLRLDSDDVALPRLVEAQLHFMETHPEISASGVRMGYVYKDRRQFQLRLGSRWIAPQLHAPDVAPSTLESSDRRRNHQQLRINDPHERAASCGRVSRTCPRRGSRSLAPLGRRRA
jgi:glycosyltransferase involved in cell wall biosynthesis